MAQFEGRQHAHSAFMARDAVAMRVVNHENRNRLGLDTEEDLAGFIQFLNWLSIVSYTPVITVMAGVMVGVMLRRVRLKTAGSIFVILAALNWTLTWWLGHHFLRPAGKREYYTPGTDRNGGAIVR
jgi:hypothetical protein